MRPFGVGVRGEYRLLVIDHRGAFSAFYKSLHKENFIPYLAKQQIPKTGGLMAQSGLLHLAFFVVEFGTM